MEEYVVKLKQMEAEMDRFEAEISQNPFHLGALGPPPPPPNRPVIVASTYNKVKRALQNQELQQQAQPMHIRPPTVTGPPGVIPFPFHAPPPPPSAGPVAYGPRFIPTQVHRAPVMGPVAHVPPMHYNIRHPQHEEKPKEPPPPSVIEKPPVITATPKVIREVKKVYAAKPMLHKQQPTPAPPPVIIPPRPPTPPPVIVEPIKQSIPTVTKPPETFIRRFGDHSKKPTRAQEMADKVKASTSTVTISGHYDESGNKKTKKPRRNMRTAGGQIWEDLSLAEWDPDDFRIFCGDLGNDVTDEILCRAFSKYQSFVKAKVVRDKRNNKTKGFGFVSFRDPQDFIRAMREMNGRYVGSRPIKLRKSSWKQRNLDVVRKKEREKQALINLVTGKQ